MARLLIFEPDAGWRQRLLALLRRAGNSETTVAANWRDACLALGQETHDVAILAVSGGGAQLGQWLRLIQGDLRLILLSDDGEDAKQLGEAYQGVVLRQDVARALVPVLRQVMSQRVKVAGGVAQGPLTLSQLRNLVGALNLPEGVEAAVLANSHGLAARQGDLSERQSVALAVYISRTWEVPDYKTQISLLAIPGKSGLRRIYARRLTEAFHVFVLGQPAAPLRRLRHVADQLAEELARQLRVSGRAPLVARNPKPDSSALRLGDKSEAREPAPPAAATRRERGDRRDAAVTLDAETGMERQPEPVTADQTSQPGSETIAADSTFAMAWRASEPMDAALCEAVQHELERLAAEFACQLHFLDVNADLVHLVISCPDGRSSLWLSERFKHGSESGLKEASGERGLSWANGYYARQTTSPLPASELRHFLEQNRAEIA